MKVPLIANMTEFGKSPLLSAAELAKLGYAAVLFPVTTLRIAMKAVEACAGPNRQGRHAKESARQDANPGRALRLARLRRLRRAGPELFWPVKRSGALAVVLDIDPTCHLYILRAGCRSDTPIFATESLVPEPAGDELERPRRMLVPRSRRLVIDLLHFQAKVPTCAHDRNCDFRRMAEARERCPVRISWSMIFIKAFGLVADRYPALRQMYLPFPWPHIYQHPTSVAMVATHRDHCGEPWLFWSRFTQPEKRPLVVPAGEPGALPVCSGRGSLSLAAAIERFADADPQAALVVDFLCRWTGTSAAVGHVFPDDDCRPGGRDSASARVSDLERDLWADRRAGQEPRDDRL